MADFDLAVIGAGAAGLSVVAAAAQLGVRVAVIERDRMGGDCLNYGCVPSKALLAAAHAASALRGADRFGIRVTGIAVDWPAVRAHLRGVIEAIAPTDSAARFRALGASVISGEARFVGPQELAVGDERLRARRIVIAAGSEAAVPKIPGLSHLAFHTNETIFSIERLPEHLLILGGGSIGLEMADAFCGLGSKVTVIEARRLAGKDDPELVGGLRSVLERRGVTFNEGTEVLAAEAGPTLVLEDGRRISGSALLVAVGRRPRLKALELSAGNVRVSDAGVVTDRRLRSVSNPRVFAVGDIADPIGIGPRAFTHVASYHAGIVIRRALFRIPAKLDYVGLPRVIYTEPELAQVGLTEAAARGEGRKVNVLRCPIGDNDRAHAERRPDGLVKLVTQNGRVVGAGILAPHAGEMISTWTLAIAGRVPVSSLAGMIVPYPTFSEAGKRAVQGEYISRLFSRRTRTLVGLIGRLP